jgi:hypothetical protein
MVMIFCVLVIISIPLCYAVYWLTFCRFFIFIVVDLEWKLADGQRCFGKHIDIFVFLKMSSQLRGLYRVDLGIIIFKDKLQICEIVFKKDLSLHKLYGIEREGD